MPSHPPTAPRHAQLQGIQTARGVAALLVVLYHAGRAVSLPQYVGFVPLGGFFSFGHAGVDFFFVLSGFIIVYVHAGDVGHPGGLGRYIWRRLTRIYPTYWCVMLGLLALAVFKPRGLGNMTLDYVVLSGLLVPFGPPPFVGGAWTLRHEMFFYALFGLAILDRRLGAVVFAAWFAGIVAALPMTITNHALDVMFSAFNLDFFMGAAVAWIVRTRRVPAPRLILIMGIAAFLAVGLLENADVFQPSTLPSRLLFGMTSAVVVLGLVAAEQQGHVYGGRIGVFLGAASYSIYLTHLILLGPTAKGLTAIGLTAHAPGAVIMLIAVGIALGAGCAFHLLVEVPLGRLVNAVRWAPTRAS